MRYVSGWLPVLSFQTRRDLLLDAAQLQADGICRGTEDDGDLARLELLPGPEADELAIFFAELEEGLLERRVVRCPTCISDAAAPRFRFESLYDTKPAPLRPSVIAQYVTGDAIAPREGVLSRNLVEATPNHEQRLGEKVVGLVSPGASKEILLQRLEYNVNDALEPPGAEICGQGHDLSLSMSGFAVILSPNRS